MKLGGRGSSGIHKSQRVQANSSDKQKKGRLASSLAEGRWILGGARSLVISLSNYSTVLYLNPTFPFSLNVWVSYKM